MVPNAAIAEGALAVGSTGNVVKDGVAYGSAYNYSTRDEAIAKALAKCRDYKSAARAIPHCRIVATFKRECFAVANDPKAGTPGTGWATASNKATAQERALAACKSTAGTNRQDACVVDQSYCDERD
jgi:uncharacterized protein (DUF1501 family)